MSINKRFTACVITSFILLSILMPLTEKTRAEDEFFDAESLLEIINIGKQLINFENIMDPHPFRFIGVWNSNKTMTINDDITFDLYFSSTLLTQLEFLDYQDSINISIHHRDESGLIKQVEGANINMKLEPVPLNEFIQEYQVTLKNINLEVEENDDLIFVIEIIQSEKPINDFVEKRFDTKIKNRIEKIASLMQNTGDPDLENISVIIEDVLNNLSDLNIGGEEFGALVNVLASSAFYYGSSSYPSMVKFSTEQGDNNTLYFHNEVDYSFESSFMDFGYIKTMNGTAPSVHANYAYPPIAVNLDELAVTEMNEEEWVSWLAVWVLYVFEEPASIANRVTYYLHSGGLMDSSKPETSDPQRDKLSENPVVWTGSSFERNKILKNVTADLYIYYPKLLTLKKTKITAVLKQGNETIATSEAELDRTTIIEKLKRGADIPTRFYFEDLAENQEIWYNKDLTIEISVSNAPFSLFKSPMISYDSSPYPSKITLSYEETDNIKLNNLEDKEVYAGGTIEYTLNIESKYSDTVEITIEKTDGIGDWNYSIYPTKLQMNEGETEEIQIIVESEATDANAYDDGDFIQLAINLSGNTGYNSNTTNISVSESAVDYGIEIITPEDIEIRHGSESTFTFIIKNKNKGYIADRYTFNITTEHGWEVSYIPYIEDYIDVSEEAEVNITLSVPWYTDIKNEEITFEVTSDESEKYELYTKTITINVSIGSPSIFDSVYQLFENAAKTIGLGNISEKYAGWILIALITIIILIISLLVIILKKIKYIELNCPEQIIEINSDETAVYNITIKNPYKSVLNYEIKIETENNDSKSWDITTDTAQVMLEPKHSKEIKLYVRPTDYVKKEDWVEAKVIAKSIEKNKTVELSTVTSIKNAEVDVKMAGVFNWPRIFKKDERVETSFKLFNRGNVSANNISVILYVNGKEKNKVKNITIPRGGHADINIPWIAVKGKNEIYIVVK